MHQVTSISFLFLERDQKRMPLLEMIILKLSWKKYYCIVMDPTRWLRPFSLLTFSLLTLHCWIFIVGIFHCWHFHCCIFIVKFSLSEFSLSNFHCFHFHCWNFIVKFSLLPFSLSNFHCCHFHCQIFIVEFFFIVECSLLHHNWWQIILDLFASTQMLGPKYLDVNPVTNVHVSTQSTIGTSEHSFKSVDEGR